MSNRLISRKTTPYRQSSFFRFFYKFLVISLVFSCSQTQIQEGEKKDSTENTNLEIFFNKPETNFSKDYFDTHSMRVKFLIFERKNSGLTVKETEVSSFSFQDSFIQSILRAFPGKMIPKFSITESTQIGIGKNKPNFNGVEVEFNESFSHHAENSSLQLVVKDLLKKKTAFLPIQEKVFYLKSTESGYWKGSEILKRQNGEDLIWTNFQGNPNSFYATTEFSIGQTLMEIKQISNYSQYRFIRLVPIENRIPGIILLETDKLGVFYTPYPLNRETMEKIKKGKLSFSDLQGQELEFEIVKKDFPFFIFINRQR